MNPSGNYKVLMTMMAMDIGGAETHVLELSKALKSKGLTVYVASNGGRFEEELRAAGITHFKVPLHNKRLSNLIRSYKCLKKIIRENDIKLVHAHARIPAFLCGLLRRKLHFKFVTTAHFPFSTVFPFRLLSNWGERALSVSEDLRDYLIKNYDFAPEHIRLTVNGIDTERFSPDTDYSGIIKEFGLDINRKRLVFVSRLRKEATPPAHQLLACANRILDACGELDIIIVGDGDDYAALSREADGANAKAGRKFVHMAGGRTDVNKFLAAAYLFVGVSRSALEAMTCRPVVLAGKEGYLGVFSEEKLEAAIDTNFCCRGCGFADDGRFIEDILYVINADAERYDALTAFCRETVASRYSVGRMADDALEVYEGVRPREKATDVIISGYYGENNSGDDLILKSIVDDLKAVKPDADIAVLSKRPRETAAAYGVRAIHKFNPFAVHKALNRANLLISGGGTLVTDITSTRSLIYYLYIITAARRKGARTMLYASGISVNKEKNRRRAAEALCTVDVIALREAESLKALTDMGVAGPEVHVTADAAFALNNTDERTAEALLNRLGVRRDYFVVSVRGWKRLPPGFESEITAFADIIKERCGLEAVFIPMQPRFDTGISRRIIGKMREPGVFAETETADQLLGIVGRARFVLTMRLHTLIYAAISATPVVALVYDAKVKSMMDTLGQKTYLDLKDTQAKRLAEFAEEIMANRAAASESISAAAAVQRERAAENIRLARELMERAEF